MGLLWKVTGMIETFRQTTPSDQDTLYPSKIQLISQLRLGIRRRQLQLVGNLNQLIQVIYNKSLQKGIGHRY